MPSTATAADVVVIQEVDEEVKVEVNQPRQSKRFQAMSSSFTDNNNAMHYFGLVTVN